MGFGGVVTGFWCRGPRGIVSDFKDRWNAVWMLLLELQPVVLGSVKTWVEIQRLVDVSLLEGPLLPSVRQSLL